MYTLKISEKQARVISVACEVFLRMGLGQFDYATESVWMDRVFGVDPNHPVDREEFKGACDRLKHVITGHKSNASLGVGSKEVNPDCHIAWEIHQVIRHQIYWDKFKDNPNRPFTVDAGTPMKYSNEKLPEIVKE